MGSDLMERFDLYIDGDFCQGAARFESRDPATGTVWAEMAEARAAEVDRAVTAAKRAFESGPWAEMTASARGALLMKLADLIEREAPELARLETRDTGKIIRETSAQIAYVAQYYRYYAGLADKIEGAHLPIDKPDMEVWLRREPVGVVAAIVPWNSQLFLSAVKIGPALAAGFPAGVVNILTGFGPSCGAALTSHPDIAHIAFTGGPQTARAVLRGSAENLARASLELGGKSPFIVFADADQESALNAQIAGIFAATGPSCVAGSRLLVQDTVAEGFLAALVARGYDQNRRAERYGHRDGAALHRAPAPAPPAR